MTTSAQGSCVCGAVAWSVRPAYRFFQYCHCSRCRKRSGSVHAANIAVPDTQLDWVRGEDVVTRFELPSAKSWSNAFCSKCGSAAPWKTRNGKGYIVPAGGMEGPLEHGPTRNIHFASRAQWYVHATALPFFDEEATS